MEHLANGGVLILFPAGKVATSTGWWGPAIEAEWNVFTAKMLKNSKATVLPIFFPGQNTRLYHIADKISPTFRQGLLLHEVAACPGQAAAPRDRPSRSAPRNMAPWLTNPRGFSPGCANGRWR